MSFKCTCPYCPAILEAPDEYDGQEVKCASCGGEFIAEKPAPPIIPRADSKVPILPPPPKNQTNQVGCVIFIILFGIAYIALTTCDNNAASKPSGESAREFRIKKEMERIEYEKARAVRDALEHIEARQRIGQ